MSDERDDNFLGENDLNTLERGFTMFGEDDPDEPEDGDDLSPGESGEEDENF